MLKLLQPDLAVDSIFHIDLAGLNRAGIEFILIDLDNTITEWNNHHLPEKAVEWFTSLNDYGLKACLVSNLCSTGYIKDYFRKRRYRGTRYRISFQSPKNLLAFYA